MLVVNARLRQVQDKNCTKCVHYWRAKNAKNINHRSRQTLANNKIVLIAPMAIIGYAAA